MFLFISNNIQLKIANVFSIRNTFYSLLLGLLSISYVSQAQDLDCQKFRYGTFEILIEDSIDSYVLYVERKENKLSLYAKKDLLLAKFRIEWINDCTYTLNHEVGDYMKGRVRTDTIEIVETKNNEYFFRAETFYDAPKGTIFRAVRTNNSDNIKGQLKTTERLMAYMVNKDYENAISLFSTKQQKIIRAIQKDPEEFKLWSTAWTLNKSTYERYVAYIKRGKGTFVFENGEWKIDEK